GRLDGPQHLAYLLVRVAGGEVRADLRHEAQHGTYGRLEPPRTLRPVARDDVVGVEHGRSAIEDHWHAVDNGVYRPAGRARQGFGRALERRAGVAHATQQRIDIVGQPLRHRCPPPSPIGVRYATIEPGS